MSHNLYRANNTTNGRDVMMFTYIIELLLTYHWSLASKSSRPQVRVREKIIGVREKRSMKGDRSEHGKKVDVE